MKSERQENKEQLLVACPFFTLRSSLAMLFCILILSALTFSPALLNGFTNWDDPVYILNNPLLNDLSRPGVQKIFSSFVSGNYHPLTIISLAIDRHVFGLNPAGYHLHSLALHLINTGLVFYLINLLTGKRLVALITALLFSIHPLQVEAVAWASSRKDVLFACFYLCSLISYSRGVNQREERQGFYFLSFAFFLLSLLAKPQAASLPFVLLGIDSYCRRPLNKAAWLEKIPFIFWAIVAGGAAYWGQQTLGSIHPSGFGPGARLLLVSHSFLSYLSRFLFPSGLSNCYPYPLLTGARLPLLYYLAPLVIAGIVFLLKRLRPAQDVVLGVVLFCVPTVFALKFVPVGDFIAADRYMYIPVIGLSFLAALLIDFLLGKNRSRAVRTVFCLVGAGAILALALSSARRCAVWKDSVTLWSDVLEKEPTAFGALINRANGYVQQGKYPEALHDLDLAVNLAPGSLSAVMNRAAVHSIVGNFARAIKDFDRALAMSPDNAVIYNNRGDLYLNMKEHKKALADLNRAVRWSPEYAQAYYNRARVFWSMKRYPDARADLDRLIALEPEDARAFAARGEVLLAQKRYDAALKDFTKSLILNPQYTVARQGYARAYEQKLRAAGLVNAPERCEPGEDSRK